jgi:hypothetical protein
MDGIHGYYEENELVSIYKISSINQYIMYQLEKVEKCLTS